MLLEKRPLLHKVIHCFLYMLHFVEKERFSRVIYCCLWTYFTPFSYSSIVEFWQVNPFLGSCTDSFILRNIQVFRGSYLCFCSFPIPWGEALILALYWQLFLNLLYISKLRKPNRVICFLVKYILCFQDQRFVSGIEASFPT